MGQPVNRGEVWWAEIGRKRRPVLVLTRPEVIDVRELVTVAEITTTVRGLAVEVPLEGIRVRTRGDFRRQLRRPAHRATLDARAARRRTRRRHDG